MVIWIAAILLIAAVALFVAAPLSDHEPADSIRATSTDSERRKHEHALAVQALRDLEFDHAMGKLDLDDYRALRLTLEARALASMAEQAKESRRSSTISVEPLPPMVPRPVAVNFCPQCGAGMKQDHNFCPNCGKARASISEENSPE